MRDFLLVVLLCSASACGPTQQRCGPSSCTGCCDSNGQCQSGGTTSACGTRGTACQVCGGLSATCVAGSCSSIGPSGGSGAGGGSAGGSGGGAAGGSSVGGGTTQLTGDLALLWSFNGQRCVFVPQVVNVRVTIPGLTLQNNGLYPCTTAGNDGITLLNLAAGTYTVTLEGLDSAGAVRFSGSRQVVVNGNVSLAVDLLATAGALRLSWSFPQAARCAQTGDQGAARPVTSVVVTVDSLSPLTFTCLDGSTADSATAAATVGVSPGAHTLQLRALDSTGFEFYAATTTVTATSTSMNVPVALQWTVGSLPLRWSFLNQGATISCAQAQVTDVFINLRNQQTQRFVYVDAAGMPTAGVGVPCLGPNNLQGTLFPFVPSATYEVFLQAAVTGNAYIYRTTQTPAPLLQVSPAVFAQSPAMGQVLTLE